MASITVKNSAGDDAGTLDLDTTVFGMQPNVPLMHQVVTAQLAARRSGTQSTKTRAEVRGGGRKPFKQKGTGNARQGSSRSPHMSGGGVAHGPKPRKYDQKTPKKMIKLALHSALSDRAADGKVVVVDSWGFDAPKTKGAKKLLTALGVDGKALVVVDIDDTNTIKSFLNLPDVSSSSAASSTPTTCCAATMWCSPTRRCRVAAMSSPVLRPRRPPPRRLHPPRRRKPLRSSTSPS